MKELLAVLAPIVLVAHLVRLTVRDGYGTLAPPRSHDAERGTRVERELGR